MRLFNKRKKKEKVRDGELDLESVRQVDDNYRGRLVNLRDIFIAVWQIITCRDGYILAIKKREKKDKNRIMIGIRSCMDSDTMFHIGMTIMKNYEQIMESQGGVQAAEEILKGKAEQ